jgi:hypothetical protein
MELRVRDKDEVDGLSGMYELRMELRVRDKDEVDSLS